MPKRCPKCDMELPVIVPPPPPADGAADPDTRCPNCGERVLEEVPENVEEDEE